MDELINSGSTLDFKTPNSTTEQTFAGGSHPVSDIWTYTNTLNPDTLPNNPSRSIIPLDPNNDDPITLESNKDDPVVTNQDTELDLKFAICMFLAICIAPAVLV
jgi:hypothetical protein